MKITPFKVIFMLNSDPLEFLRYLLPFKSYVQKCSTVLNSAANLLDKRKNVHLGFNFYKFLYFLINLYYFQVPILF